MSVKLTKAQREALLKYADGEPKNETAEGINGRVYNSLTEKKLINRSRLLHSKITEAGRAALSSPTRAA